MIVKTEYQNSDLNMTTYQYKKLVNNGNKVKIILHDDSSHLCISNNSKSGNPQRLAGHVEVTFKIPHSDIQDIKLRFLLKIRTKTSKPNGSRFKPKLICERLSQESRSPPKSQRLLTDEILKKI